MVKIPALELEGQNWKFYRAKYLEAAATYYCLDVLGGRPDDGTDDWEEGNALLCSLFMETIPASIYYRIRLKSAHQIYNHLAKHFRDNDPIQELCAKKFAARANKDKRYSSAESPTSENAATGADWEDPPTKDLNRGTEDVNDRNVGREDPRTSFEASAKGTSAECANGTLVLLTGEPHETQNVPRNSLPLTLRLPIDGKPGECKQEAANGVVTAERTKGTVGMAEPNETDADVDGKAALGRELAERVQGVGEGDETEREHESQLQQTNCKANRQRNGNANMNVPNTYGLPLVGEWEVCASGRLSCESGTSERASAGELEMPTECCQQLCMAHGDPGRGVEPADVSNKMETLIIVSIVSEEPGGGGIPRVHLRGASWRTGDANGVGNRTEGSTGQANVSRARADASNVPNRAETDGMSCDEGAGTYLSVRNAKRVVHATDGVGSQSDASIGHSDVPCVDTDAITPANATEIVSTTPRRKKPPDSPMETARQRSDAPDRCGSHTDASSARTHAYCIGNDMETATNETEIVRSHQVKRKSQDSPNGRDIATPELPGRWRKVSIGGGDVYVLLNTPIAVPTRQVVFGRVESGVKAIAPSVEVERAVEGDGNRYGGDGDGGSTTSSGNANSKRVGAALLAAKSQYTRYRPRSRRNDLPMSSRPPIHLESRLYGHVRRRRRRGRLKIERINCNQVSQTPEVETTYLGRAHAMQPPGNTPNRAYGTYRPRRRRGRIKSAPTNVSRTRNGGNAYLRRDNAIRLMWRPKRQIRRLNKLTFKYRMPGEPWRDAGDYG